VNSLTLAGEKIRRRMGEQGGEEPTRYFSAHSGKWWSAAKYVDKDYSSRLTLITQPLAVLEF
jgi:hypothetical protein